MRFSFLCLFTSITLWILQSASAQELEPRRWSHLPKNTHFAGGGYAFTTGDIQFNPVLRIENGEVDLHTFAFKYIHSFEVFGKSARFDIGQAYQSGKWNGILDGSPAETVRNGPSDTLMRFAVNLYGAPALDGRDFAEYRKNTHCETIVGAGLVAHLPTGSYYKDRLINLGGNRFTFRPQIGVVHNRGNWSSEFTASAWLFTDNNSFYNGNRLEQDPLLAVQGHLTYTFRPGLWASWGLGYGFLGESTINGAAADDSKENLVWALAAGLPITRQLGVKFAYIGSHSFTDTGSDLNTFSVGLSAMW